MGSWGMKPWETDSAADWYDSVMENSGLPSMVEAALILDPGSCHEEIRAAAYVLISLGRAMIWPIDKLDARLKLAIEKLRYIATMKIYAQANFGPVIEKEIAELESRLNPDFTGD
jgi:hypothetical protein